MLGTWYTELYGLIAVALMLSSRYPEVVALLQIMSFAMVMCSMYADASLAAFQVMGSHLDRKI